MNRKFLTIPPPEKLYNTSILSFPECGVAQVSWYDGPGGLEDLQSQDDLGQYQETQSFQGIHTPTQYQETLGDKADFRAPADFQMPGGLAMEF